MIILSFIIPAYNSMAFLDKCIQSMLVPEILEKLEIIVVNDGSTDSTAEIAANYQSQYPNVVRLISQENKGHGGALNTGCAAAQGKYIKVIDADDWVKRQNLPEFVRLLEQCDSDVVLTHYRTIDITTGETKNWCCYPEMFGRAYTLGEIMERIRDFERALTFHGITYRRDFYQAHAEALPEHVFHEDNEYAAFPCCHARSVTCLELFIYEYRVGDVGQSVAEANQLRRMDQVETVIRRMIRRGQALPAGPGRDYATRKVHGLVSSYLDLALLSEPDRKKGRQMATAIMDLCQQEVPQVHTQALPKYLVFSAMNRLHIGRDVWDWILNSWFYSRIRGGHTFE